MKTIILDAGHGMETPGKRSPIWADGRQLYEWEFNRDMVTRIHGLMTVAGLSSVILNPESLDVSLAERCRRENRYFDNHNGQTVLFSIHANAGGGTGFEVFTSKGETKADKIASGLIEQLKKDFPGIKMRQDMSDGDQDKEADFYILKHSKSPAILAENLFMDNENDCRLLLDYSFRVKLAQSYFDFIKTIV